MMKYILVALLAVSIAIALPVFVEAKTYTVPEEFSFEYPNNWKIEERENRFTTFDAKLHDRGGDDWNAEMTFEGGMPEDFGYEAGAAALNDRQQVIDALESVAENLYDASIYESGDTKYTIGNRTAQYTIGTFTDTNLFGYEHDMVVMSVFTKLSNDEIVIIQYIAEENDFDKYLPKVEQVLQSIEPATQAVV